MLSKARRKGWSGWLGSNSGDKIIEASLTRSATREEVWKKTHIKIRDEKEVWVETQTEDTYIITMDSIAEVLGISTLKPRDCIWMIKVLVIESGPTKPFKNEGDSRKMVILVDEEVKYGKFTATIAAILNSDEPYYDSCTNCYRKVKIADNIAKCPGSPTGKITYVDRFLLKFDVFAGDERCSITLFEAAKHLVGFDVTTYKQSTLEKKEESLFYRNLMLSISKVYTFLIKIDAKSEGDRAGRCFIAEEVQEVK
ncbi:hypothetical protein FXO38_07268 [Capsicum annuum]|nr:hypothetical protein FXO38_07268 [Capsicum annuum]